MFVMLLAAVSGLAYAGMKYLMEPSDPFSAYGHPAQPYALGIHVLVSPILLFVLGVAYGAHALREARAGRWRSGTRLLLILLTVVAPMSGFVLQVAAATAGHDAIAWLHGLSATALAIGIVVHSYWS